MNRCKAPWSIQANCQYSKGDGTPNSKTELSECWQPDDNERCDHKVRGLRVRCEACGTEFEPVIRDWPFKKQPKKKYIECHVCRRRYFESWYSDRLLTILE